MKLYHDQLGFGEINIAELAYNIYASLVQLSKGAVPSHKFSP